MKFRVGIFVAVAVAMVALAGVALARNPHCAGGIQYVVGGLRDKEKGLTDDYLRQMNKAVQQLEQCAGEDGEDFEAIGYLGWAYAELDSAGPAGAAFQKAIDGLTAKGDKKKVDVATQNRESYWSRYFNDGIAKIGEAQSLYPDFAQSPKDDGEKVQKEEAQKRYEAAMVAFTRASLLKPNDSRTMRSLGTVYYLTGDYASAMKTFQAGLSAAPGDTALQESMKSTVQQYANSLLEAKKYDEAIETLQDLIKSDANNADLYLGLGSAYFSRAQGKEGDARKPDFVLAGDTYAKAGALRPSDADLTFNAALAYQKGGAHDKSVGQWLETLKRRPDDADATAALAESYSELKQWDEAVKVLHTAVLKTPQASQLHRQLGSVYSKAGNTAKATEELLMFLSMRGTPAPDPAATAKGAKAGSAAAQTLASQGAPDAVYAWEGDGQKYQSWMYWSKKVAFHFNTEGAQAAKTDWSTTAAAAKK